MPERDDFIVMPDAPAIAGLRFRRFRGECDFPSMAQVFAASAEADGVEAVLTVKDIANAFAHPVNTDPSRDMIFAQIEGQTVGVAHAYWSVEDGSGQYLYQFFGCLMPSWRRKGIGRIMLGWIENRLREVALGHPFDRPKFFECCVRQAELGKSVLLQKAGYRPARYFHEMLRPSMDDIPLFPLPDGLEIRPVTAEHYRLIWEAENEALRDHWGHLRRTEEDYLAWLNCKAVFQPHLWQVAWDILSGQVAGQVRPFILDDENEKYCRKRGYTEFISVRRRWRKRGLARALIARSLNAQKELGMSESALGVDSENLSGAVQLYESCGFRAEKRNTIFRKPF